MKNIILALLLIATFAQADVKISQLPLGSAASTSSTDSFPYVNSIAGETERLDLSDLINLPALATPTFSGKVTAPSIRLTTGAQSGYCWVASDSSGNGEWGSCASASGTVTSVSIVGTNGFTGSVANANTTPAITLETTISGILKGNGTALSSATSGTDYAPGTSGLSSCVLCSTTSTGALSCATSGEFPTLNQNTTGSAGSLTQSLTANDPVIGNGTGIAVGTRSGNTTDFATTTGSLVNGDCVEIDSSGNFIDAGAACGSGGGGGSPGGSSTDIQYNNSSSFGGSSNFTYNGSGTVQLGTDATTAGVFGLSNGNTSGKTVSIQNPSATTAYNFNLPATAGSSGEPLLSGGGSSSAMTWGTLSGNTSEFATASGSLTSGHLASWDSSGNAIDSGVAKTAVGVAGSSSDVQYNASGSFAGDSSFTYDGSGTVTATTFVGALTGNATTATALASAPTSCSGNDWATGIAADGDASCSQPAFSNISGTAQVSQGGTGVTSVTTTPTASSFAGWDANSNLSANGFGPAYATTATAGSTTTLTIASPQVEDFSGTTFQTIVLPVVSTLPQAGYPFVIGNNSTGLLTVESSGGNVISTVASGQTQTYRAVSLTGTTAASWEAPSALGYVAQAQLIGQVKITGCSSNWTTTSTSLAAFSAQSGCTYTTTYGSALAPSTNIPGITFASLPPGNYTLKYEGLIGAVWTSVGSTAQFQFTDGTNVANEISEIGNSSTSTDAFLVSGIQQTISYASPQSNVTLQIYGATFNAGTSANIFGATPNPGVISVYYYPTQSQLVQTPNNSNGNWGGTSTQSGSTTSTTTTDPTSVSGSVTTTGTPQNISCTADATYLGIDCTLPQTGNYLVCFTGEFGNTTTGAVGYGFVTDGNNNSITGGQSGYATVVSGGMPAGACGNYTATSTSVIFKIRGQASSNTADFSVSTWSVASLATSLTRAISPGSVTSSGPGQYHNESAFVNCSSSSSVLDDSSWISIGNISGGSCSLTFTAGEFSTSPNCTTSVNGLASTLLENAQISISNNTSGAIGLTYISSGSNTVTQGTDNNFMITCGPTAH